MEYRAGKCSQCGAEYQVPASFAHNVARCRKCRGVVHLSAAPRVSASATRPPGAPAVATGPAECAAPESDGEPVAAARAPFAPETVREAAQPGAPPPRVPAPARRPKPLDAAGSVSPSWTGKPARRASEPARKRRKPLLAVILVGLAAVAAALYFLRRRNESAAPDATSPAPTTGAAPSRPAASGASGPAAPEGGSAFPSGG